MFNSLHSRLLIMTFIALSALAISGGILLQNSYSLVQMNGLKERLKVHNYNLLAQVDLFKNKLTVPSLLADQHFNSLDSGLYAMILDANNQRVWSSISAKNLPIFPSSSINIGNWKYSLAKNEHEELFIARYGVSWGEKHSYNILLIEDMRKINQSLSEYKEMTTILLICAVLFLLIMQFLILRWGLKPLSTVSLDLKRIQGGEKFNLSGVYPKELMPLTKNLNHLLDIEQKQRERYRNSLADLSHSLKTPISVMKGVIEQDMVTATDNQTLTSQLNRMTDTIRYQLQRAANGFQGLYINRIPVQPMVRSIVDAMKKVYADKNIAISLNVPVECHFHGDEDDLMEILANLIDNACKYCRKNVFINIESNTDAFMITISDDGEGIPEAQRDTILKRGVRLDSIEPGQGMGLALVKEILNAYQAEMKISDSSLGGASFKLCFNSQITNNN